MRRHEFQSSTRRTPLLVIGASLLLALQSHPAHAHHAVRIVWHPMEIALPVPLVGQLPLYYEQFRFMLGIQIGG